MTPTPEDSITIIQNLDTIINLVKGGILVLSVLIGLVLVHLFAKAWNKVG